MLRIKITAPQAGVDYRYIDSIHGALVNGLTAAGLSGEDLVGRSARPWTFACGGFARPGGWMTTKRITVSTPDDAVAEAMRKLNPRNLVKQSSNGDTIDLSSARIGIEHRGLAPGQSEACIAFASRFAIIAKKSHPKEKTRFVQSPSETNFAQALKRSLDRRAGRELDLMVSIDSLTLMTEANVRMMSLRKSGHRRIMIPAFNMPITLRGNEDDLAWAFHAGMGAKANLGFGCPILRN